MRQAIPARRGVSFVAGFLTSVTYAAAALGFSFCLTLLGGLVFGDWGGPLFIPFVCVGAAAAGGFALVVAPIATVVVLRVRPVERAWVRFCCFVVAGFMSASLIAAQLALAFDGEVLVSVVVANLAAGLGIFVYSALLVTLLAIPSPQPWAAVTVRARALFARVLRPLAMATATACAAGVVFATSGVWASDALDDLSSENRAIAREILDHDPVCSRPLTRVHEFRSAQYAHWEYTCGWTALTLPRWHNTAQCGENGLSRGGWMDVVVVGPCPRLPA